MRLSVSGHPIRITRSPIRSISTSQQFEIAMADPRYVMRIADRVMRIGLQAAVLAQAHESRGIQIGDNTEKTEFPPFGCITRTGL